VIVRYLGPDVSDLQTLDLEGLRLARRLMGRLAHVKDVSLGGQIGESRSDPLLRLRFADGTEWAAFLNEVQPRAVDLVTREQLDAEIRDIERGNRASWRSR